MTKWIQFDPVQLIPTDLADLAEEAATVGDTLGTILETAATVLDVVSLFVQGYQDAQKALVEALQDAIYAVTQQLTQTGVYWLVHVPASRKIRSDPEYWLSDVAKSLDDVYDENRPILVDPSAFVGCIAVMGTTQSFDDLYIQFQKLFLLFGALVPDEITVSSWPSIGDPFTPVPGVGQAPDWGSKRIADLVPDTGRIVDVLNDFADSITAAAGASDIYGLFGDLLRQKADILREIGDTVDAIIAAITENTDFGGAYLLPIYGQGDSEWLKSQLAESTGGPMDLDTDYSAGMVFLTTGATTAGPDLLFDMFGLL